MDTSTQVQTQASLNCWFMDVAYFFIKKVMLFIYIEHSTGRDHASTKMVVRSSPLMRIRTIISN